MINKINICPVIKDHFDTLADAQGKRVLKRDIFLFYLTPLLIAIFVEYLEVQIPSKHLNTAIICHSIFIPLILNAIFLIYSILDKIKTKKKSQDKKPLKVLDHLYKNLAYTLLASSVSLFFLVLYSISFHYVISYIIRVISTFLILNILLTTLMIIKRCHLLLKGEIV